MPKNHEYYVYIVTNSGKTVFYTGVTNNLSRRLIEHWENRGGKSTFAGRYYCYYLIFYEKYKYISNAISREKEIKGWRREKKLTLVKNMNPDLSFLNAAVCGGWPPDKIR